MVELNPNLSDPLSDVTRKERKFLILFSTLSIAIVLTGLIPTEISALGVKFDQANQVAILLLFVAVIVYYLVSFTSYVYYDRSAWDIKLSDRVIDRTVDQFDKEIEFYDGARITETRIKPEIVKTLLFSISKHHGPYLKRKEPLTDDEKEILRVYEIFRKKSTKATMLRRTLDFYFPIIMGIIAIGLLVYKLIVL
ncbi:MAG: hypothetical protein K9G76_10325 [Bacteroidales bacterium]|nr:hypothetical protein [Bacteroidales bacterium]MCF8405232.1 hypothetical protein [Bacteroidales bacterium]